MRKSTLSFLIVFGAAMLIAGNAPLWAQNSPPISATVQFDKDSYDYGEPVGVTVTVTNTSGQYLRVNKGFSSRLFYLEMRVIDPAGRLLLPQCPQPRTENPDTPPLGWASCGNTQTQVALYEVLPPGWSVTSHTADIGSCYRIKFPGHYSAEVQLSVMVFGQSGQDPGLIDPCKGDIQNYAWLGVVNSEPTTLHTQGTTEVDIIPKYWLHWWKDGLYLLPDLAVVIWPEQGKTVDDYRLENIQLNNVAAKEVHKLYSFERKKYYLLALFDKQKVINSLGAFQVGQWYPVVISGMMKVGGLFGGGEKVQIIY